MDKATRVLDNVVMPRAVMAVNGGALIAEPPNLFFCKDTDGDGKADVKDVVTTDFGTKGGQPEHMANTPVWAMDNAIWSAGYGTRLKLRGGSGCGTGPRSRPVGSLPGRCGAALLQLQLRHAPGRPAADGGLCQESAAAQCDQHQCQARQRSDAVAAHPTPGVNRGYDAKTLRADGTLAEPTATCGALIYRGDAFPAAYRGNAFVPEPARIW
jgi:hypothetical protein